MPVQPDLNRLKNQLAAAKVRDTDFPLFQVINQLIEAIRQLQGATTAEINTVSGAVDVGNSYNYLTHSDQTLQLPSSRRLVAGDGVTIDITNPGEMEISAGGTDHVIMSNGDSVPLGDGDGGFIYTEFEP